MKSMRTTNRKYDGNSLSRKLKLAILMFGCALALLGSAQAAAAQCQYDWRQQGLPFGNRVPSPEIGMSDRDKVAIAQACDKLYKKFINVAKRADREVRNSCQDPRARWGQANVISLDSSFYRQFYKPLLYPDSIKNDLRSISIWYDTFDCATREAVFLLQTRYIHIPNGLEVIRTPKPTASGNYSSPTILARTEAFEPRATIIFPEWDDADYSRYNKNLKLRGVVLSAIGEILHEREAGEFYYSLSGRKPGNSCQSVSPRACDSVYSFVAEVFAGYVSGVRYPDAVWAEYINYRGPRYRSIRRGN